MKNKTKFSIYFFLLCLGIFFGDLNSSQAKTERLIAITDQEAMDAIKQAAEADKAKLVTPGADTQGVLPNDTRLHSYPTKPKEETAPAPAPTTRQFKYILLESFPGFFTANTEMTDFPKLVLAIYKFGIWTVGIAGLFMLVVGGFMYMASAGNTSTASNAQGIIWDALLGIVAALGAYLIFYVINPDLTKINLSFTKVGVNEPEEAQVNGSMYSSLVARNGQQIALDKLKQNGINTIVASGLRTLEKQQQLIRENCGGFPATRNCSPPTCLLKNGPASCPHTTGRAADIWALNSSGGQAIMQDQCMTNIQACFNNPYQKALIAAMHAEGFCVLASEPWHFEKPKMSSACN